MDQSYQRLQKKGVQFLSKPFTYNPPGYRIVFFRDPEGNILELYHNGSDRIRQQSRRKNAGSGSSDGI
ncbi:MAG: hypothetical protein HC780_13535 [Leptolyngbyaceae cyanobacterium CSU_1_3]|nr:hypothetical protein [Leptolyngbyaceae cyanobacterium CSU_1_3]